MLVAFPSLFSFALCLSLTHTLALDLSTLLYLCARRSSQSALAAAEEKRLAHQQLDSAYQELAIDAIRLRDRIAQLEQDLHQERKKSAGARLLDAGGMNARLREAEARGELKASLTRSKLETALKWQKRYHENKERLRAMRGSVSVGALPSTREKKKGT